MRLEGKVAIVTGSSSGLGRGTAVLFAKEGARVVVNADRNVAGGEETVGMIKKAGGEGTMAAGVNVLGIERGQVRDFRCPHRGEFRSVQRT